MATELPTRTGTGTGFAPFVFLPFEIQQDIVSFLCQQDLLNLTLVSKLFYKLSTKVLYSKIYLNDSYIEHSDICSLASSWTWLQLSATNKNADRVKEQANDKVLGLLDTLKNNKSLMNNVIELRLNWDLSIVIQKELVELLMNHSQSLRIIENITNQSLNDAIEFSKYRSNLTSLDLPPPNALPSMHIPNDYLLKTQKFLRSGISLENISNIRHLTVFLEPLMLFNNISSPARLLKLDSIKLHCRPDGYPLSVLSRNNWRFHRLNELFDVNYLKTLTIISWYDAHPPDSMFLFDHWSDFKGLEDITLIAVIYDDDKISKLIESCNELKRLKLDFSTPKREITKDSKIYRAIFNHSKSLRFLDIKVTLTHRIVNLDIRGFKVVIRIPCKCFMCQHRVANEIYFQKILGKQKDYRVTHMESFRAIDFFEQFAISSLSPYAKAVDRYPSVKTGLDDIKDFLERFNSENIERPDYVPLNEDDFYDLYHCLIHSFKPDLEPFVKKCENLKFFVLNDISFMIVNADKRGKKFRYPEPLFYNHDFKTNFGVDDIITPKTFDDEVYGPTLTLF